MSRPTARTAFARARQARDVAELAEQCRCDQLADPWLAHQRLAAWLAAGEAAQPAFERRELDLDRLDHRERDGDPLAGGLGQLDPLEEGAPGAAEQALGDIGGGDAVMEERRPDPLQPLRALLDERFAQTRARPPLDDVGGRQPGLGQTALAQQLAEVACVGSVGLRMPLLA